MKPTHYNMKLHPAIFITAILLSACNFSLAQDITPPPGYVPPTSAPTLGPLYPAQAPGLEHGAEIYAAKCAPCHGPAGLGDGEQGKQLPFPVSALGLPQVARPASPADWFSVVSLGRIERFMPPFASLSEADRWDVVAYILSLHSTPAQIARGKEIFETACRDCPLDFFSDQKAMAALSLDALAALLRTGSDQVTALSGDLSDDDLYDVAAYLRSLTFASAPAPVAGTATPAFIPAEAATLAAETASVSGTPLATESVPTSAPETTGITITGSVVGADVAGSTVKLRGFDHAQDNAGVPQEVLMLESVIAADGTFTFSGLEFVEGRIVLAEVNYSGVQYQSALAFMQAGQSEVAIEPLSVYETSTDLSLIRFDQVHMFFDIGDGVLQVIAVYTFSNHSQTTWLVESLDGIPFIKVPLNAQNPGYDSTQDSAPLLGADAGFAIPPNEMPYGLVSFYSLPYSSGMEIGQPFTQAVDALLVLVPEGVKLKSGQLTSGPAQTFNNTEYREYTGAGFAADSTVTVQLSGSPKGAGISNAGLIVGVGALGLLLVFAGLWMYNRDRRKPDADEADGQIEAEVESQEDLLDAIIALDDLHRAGKITDEAYHARRAELKARVR